MLTAVTQVDGTGGSSRQMRAFRQQSYYRSSSNGTAGPGAAPFKEQVGLLHVGPGNGTPGGSVSSGATPQLIRKGSALLARQPSCLREQEHQQRLLLHEKPSTLVLSYDSQRGGVGVGVASGLLDNNERVSSVWEQLAMAVAAAAVAVDAPDTVEAAAATASADADANVAMEDACSCCHCLSRELVRRQLELQVLPVQWGDCQWIWSGWLSGRSWGFQRFPRSTWGVASMIRSPGRATCA